MGSVGSPVRPPAVKGHNRPGGNAAGYRWFVQSFVAGLGDSFAIFVAGMQVVGQPLRGLTRKVRTLLHSIRG